MDDKHDDVRDWLGRIDPMGSMRTDGKPRKVKHVLPLAKLAVIQTIALALILALTVVGIMAVVMSGQQPQQKAGKNNAPPQPTTQLVPPPGGVPAFSIGSEAIPAPDANAGELPEKLVRWRIHSGAEKAFGPVSFSKHQFAFAGDSGNIYAVRIDGERLWTYRFPGQYLHGLVPAARSVLAYGPSLGIVLDANGKEAHRIDFNPHIRGRPNYDYEQQQLVTYSYKVAGRSGDRTEEGQVAVYNLDGSLAWKWNAPDSIYWAVPGDGDAVYALVRTGERELHGARFPTTAVCKVSPSGVHWQQDLGVHYGDSEPVLTNHGQLFVGGTADKKPALLDVDPATGKVRSSIKLERWATGPLRYDNMHSTVFIPASNMVQVVSYGQLLYKAGNDVDHAHSFVTSMGNMTLIRDYDIMMYSNLGRAGAKIPLGKDLGNRPKGDVARHENGIMAVFGGELVCFDFMADSGEMSKYVRR